MAAGRVISLHRHSCSFKGDVLIIKNSEKLKPELNQDGSLPVTSALSDISALKRDYLFNLTEQMILDHGSMWFSLEVSLLFQHDFLPLLQSNTLVTFAVVVCACGAVTRDLIDRFLHPTL